MVPLKHSTHWYIGKQFSRTQLNQVRGIKGSVNMAQLSLTRLGCKFQSTTGLVVVQHQVFSRIVIHLMLVCDLQCYLLCCLLSNFLISNSYNLSRNLKTPKHSQLVDHLLSAPGSHNIEISAYRLKGEHFFSFQINLL